LGKWTAKEDAKLTDAATKYGGKDWVAVAVLVPGRTNERCRERWVNYLDPNTKRTVGRWTADEDATLTDAVAKHGNNWVAVAALVPGRLNEQCRERWMHSEHHRISPTLGYWTAEEDAKLTDAVKKHGKEWVAVAALVPGRNNKKCRQRWTTQLDPNINNRKWTAEEDAKMMDAVTECGNDWVAIAALVPGRTNWQCRERWRVLLSDRQR
jgi:myb proto-oncogene protein